MTLFIIGVSNDIPDLKQSYFSGRCGWGHSVPDCSVLGLFCRKVKGDWLFVVHAHFFWAPFSVNSQAWWLCSAFTYDQRMARYPKELMHMPWADAWIHLCSNRTFSLLDSSILFCVTSPRFLSNFRSWPWAPFACGAATIKSHRDERGWCCSRTWKLIIPGSLGG